MHRFFPRDYACQKGILADYTEAENCAFVIVDKVLDFYAYCNKNIIPIGRNKGSAWTLMIGLFASNLIQTIASGIMFNVYFNAVPNNDERIFLYGNSTVNIAIKEKFDQVFFANEIYYYIFCVSFILCPIVGFLNIISMFISHRSDKIFDKINDIKEPEPLRHNISEIDPKTGKKKLGDEARIMAKLTDTASNLVQKIYNIEMENTILKNKILAIKRREDELNNMAISICDMASRVSKIMNEKNDTTG